MSLLLMQTIIYTGTHTVDPYLPVVLTTFLVMIVASETLVEGRQLLSIVVHLTSLSIRLHPHILLV